MSNGTEETPKSPEEQKMEILKEAAKAYTAEQLSSVTGEMAWNAVQTEKPFSTNSGIDLDFVRFNWPTIRDAQMLENAKTDESSS